jgi:restriction system protein
MAEAMVEFFSRFPWYVALIASAVIAVPLGLWFLYWLEPHPKAVNFAWTMALCLLVIAIFTLSVVAVQRSAARMLEESASLDRLRAMTWQQFEQVVGHTYRAKGYAVTQTGLGGPDGGVDLELRREGRVFLVQCKQYRQAMVGVKVVRELKGVVATRRAYGGIVVTCGHFSSSAFPFADEAGIELVDGHKLVAMVKEVNERPQ